VYIRDMDSGLIFQYRTHSSSTDCKAQAREMPKVWDRIVKAPLKSSHVQRVILFPEDDSGRSVSMEFTERPSGEWSAAAPRAILIPAS